jgi:hypothetical protein
MRYRDLRIGEEDPKDQESLDDRQSAGSGYSKTRINKDIGRSSKQHHAEGVSE